VNGTELSFDLSGLGLRLRGMPADVAPSLEKEWAGYVARVDEPFLDLLVEESADSFRGGRTLDARLDAVVDRTRARFASAQGTVEVDAAGQGRVALAQGAARHRLFGSMNLIAAATGWCLSRGRGVVLHAAGAVLEGRAFVLVGPAGAGKTTWAEAVRRAGGLVLSDDVVVLEHGEPTLALAVPFRVRPFDPPPPGRWPVAALLLARHGATSALVAVPDLLSSARLAANLLYVEPELRATPLRLGLPVRELTFSPDPSFVPLLRDFASRGPRALP